jgi:choline dehydrogenase-like flavoprotein
MSPPTRFAFGAARSVGDRTDDLRIVDSDDPLKTGRVNTGRAVGGTTVHFTAVAVRLRPDDFRVRSTDGVAVDWPFGYDELAPYYAEVERALPVSGPRRSTYPSGASCPHGELPWSDVLDEYAHWGMLAILGEVLPNPDNRVTLADELDDNGLPVGRVTFSFGDNDRAIVEAERQLAEQVMDAAGATRVLTSDGTHHLLGTCRMGDDPKTSVVGPDCTHDVSNLWFCDGPVFPTGGAVNPSLTIQAIAARTARLALDRAAERRAA